MQKIGDVIGGRYRIDAVIGRGGTSVVYRATHVALPQTVAVKVLSPAALAVPEYVLRLEREARAVSRMKSEHVVRVIDVGKLEDDGAPYLVMEHLEGEDLAAVLTRRGPLPVELALECILHACEALAEAHAMGIVHRDLKPANLFLTECLDGSPCIKVLDFGISRTLNGITSALTDPGMVLGTPSYMAPEQMESSDAVDPRIDIWALGAILYELLVGKPPFKGETLPQIFMRIMRSKTPRPSAERPGVPAVVDAVVARCLAVDPKARYQTVAELASALSAISAPRVRDSALRALRVWDRVSRPSLPAAERAASPRQTVRSALEASSSRRSRFRLLTPTVLAVIVCALAAGFASTMAVSRMTAGAVLPWGADPQSEDDAGEGVSDDDDGARAQRTPPP